MKVYAIAALLCIFATVASALTPNEVKRQHTPLDSFPCSDNETGEQGYCHLFLADGGDFYLVFTQNGEPQFVRFVRLGQPYETVWMVDNAIDL